MDALCSYLPSSVLSYLLEHSEALIKPPVKHTYETCVLFADVSGYTALCEQMAAKGPAGDEYLAKHLNSYFELLVKTVAAQGGDVFKFAGDALLVVWPPSDEDLTTLTRRAAQCALEIREKLSDVRLGQDIKLNVKVGVGVGEVNILHVGGIFGRMEYLATGAPLVQAFKAEHAANPRDCILSPEAYKLVSKYFEVKLRSAAAPSSIPTSIGAGGLVTPTAQLSMIPATPTSAAATPEVALLLKCTDRIRNVSVVKHSSKKPLTSEVLDNVCKYVPSCILPFLNNHEEFWASELRRITVLFINLAGMGEGGEKSLSMEQAQRVLEACQLAVYKYEGSLNKFLMDDKGSTLIAVFGLPPLAHEDDAVRGVLAALAICQRLNDLGLKPAIGCSTGAAFCGVVGSHQRREYSVLGDTVNLAARLMQHSAKNQQGVICDTPTQYAARHRLHFEDLPKITVRGKSAPVSIWQPYTKIASPTAPNTPDPATISIGAAPVVGTASQESKTPQPRFRGLTATHSGTMTPARRPSNPDIVQLPPKLTRGFSVIKRELAAAVGLIPSTGRTSESKNEEKSSNTKAIAIVPPEVEPDIVVASSPPRSLMREIQGAAAKRGHHRRQSMRDGNTLADAVRTSLIMNTSSPALRPQTLQSPHSGNGLALATPTALSASVTTPSNAAGQGNITPTSMTIGNGGFLSPPAATAPPMLSPSSFSSPSASQRPLSLFTPSLSTITSPGTLSSGSSSGAPSTTSTPLTATGATVVTPPSATPTPPPPTASGVRSGSYSVTTPVAISYAHHGAPLTPVGGVSRTTFHGRTPAVAANANNNNSGTPAVPPYPATTPKATTATTASTPATTVTSSSAPSASPTDSPSELPANVPPLTLTLSSSLGATPASSSALATPSLTTTNGVVIGSPAGSTMASRRIQGVVPMVQLNMAPTSAPVTPLPVPITATITVNAPPSDPSSLSSSAASTAPNSIPNTPQTRPKKMEVGAGSLIMSPVLAHRLRAGTAAAFDDEGKLLVSDLPAGVRAGLEIIDPDKDITGGPLSTNSNISNHNGSSMGMGSGKRSTGNDDREVRFYEPPLSVRQSLTTTGMDDDEERPPLHRGRSGVNDDELRHTLEEQLTRSRSSSRSTTANGNGNASSSSMAGVGPIVATSTGGSLINNAPRTPHSPARSAAAVMTGAALIMSLSGGVPPATSMLGSQQQQPQQYSPSTRAVGRIPLASRGSATGIQSRRGSVTKLRGVRVVLPDAQGTLLIPCGHLSTVRQLRDDIWQTCIARRLIADEDGSRSWLAVQGTETKLHDDLRLELLAQARQQHLVTICVLSREEEYSGCDHIRHYRDIILEHMFNTIRTGRSMTLVVEGDSGLGKTRLLSSTINESPIAIYCGAGNPFEMSKPLCVWRDIFLQLIDAELDKQRGADTIGASISPIPGTTTNPASNGPLTASSASAAGDVAANELQARRRQLVLSKLSLKPYYGQQSMDVLAPLLNDVLPLGFDDTAASRTIENNARIAHAQQLLFVLMQIFVTSGPMMIVIDDAVFLDQRSWQLLLKFSRQIEGLMLLIATRPINKSYMAAFSKSVPEEYNALVTDPQCVTINIEPRPDDVIYQIACDCLGKGITEMPALLGHLILSKAHGNPLVVQEMVYDLKKKKLITVDLMDHKVTLAQELVCPPAHTRLALPVPITLQGILGCRLDRLTHVQRMLLKAAAIIGDEFSYETLEASYPLAVETDQSLIHELQNLLEMGIVAIAYQESSDGRTGETVYTFGNGFLREMILSRMLSHQGKKLRTKVNEAFAAHLRRRAASITTMKAATSGTLLFIDGKSSDWAPRYFVLLGDMLCWWADDTKYQAKEVPSGIVYMREARVAIDETREFAWSVNSLNWMEKGEYTRVPRSFHFVCSTAKEFDVWLTLVSVVAENKNTRLSAKEMSPTMIHTLRRLKEEQDAMQKELLRQEYSEQIEREKKRVLTADEKKKYEGKLRDANEATTLTLVMQDSLGVRKQGRSLIQNDWKQRWVSLTDEGIIFRKKDWNSKDGRKNNRPTQLVSLAVGDPAVQLAGYDSTKKLFIFLLECDLWMKKGKCEWKRRKSTLSARSEEEAKKWVTSINKIIAHHRTIRYHRAITTAHMESVRSPGKGRTASFAAEDGDEVPPLRMTPPASPSTSSSTTSSTAAALASAALTSSLTSSIHGSTFAVSPATPNHPTSGASYIYTSPPPSFGSLGLTPTMSTRGSPPPSPGMFDLPTRNLWRNKVIIPPRLSDAEEGTEDGDGYDGRGSDSSASNYGGGTDGTNSANKSRGSDTPTSMSSSCNSSRAESRRSSGEWRLGVITPSNAALMAAAANGDGIPVGVNLSRRPSYSGIQVGDPAQQRRGSFSGASRKGSTADGSIMDPQISPGGGGHNSGDDSGSDTRSGPPPGSRGSLPRRGSLRPAPPRLGSRTDMTSSDSNNALTPSNAGRASRRSSANGGLLLQQLANSGSLDGLTDAAPSSTPLSDRNTPLGSSTIGHSGSNDMLRIVVDDDERNAMRSSATHIAAGSGVALPAPAGGSRPASRRGSFTRPPALGVSPMALGNGMMSPQRTLGIRRAELAAAAANNGNLATPMSTTNSGSRRGSNDGAANISGANADIISMLDSSLGLLESARDGLNPEIIRQMLLGLRDKIIRSSSQSSNNNSSASANAAANAAAAANSSNNSAAKPLSFVQMIQACDIDETTKSWLALYTKEVPDDAARTATALAMMTAETKRPNNGVAAPAVPGSPMGSPSRSLSLYHSADIGSFREWDWNIFTYDNQSLIPVVIQIFSYYNFFDLFNIPGDVFTRFVRACRKGYLDVPFHNFGHAVDVCQSVFALMVSMQAERWLTPIERFALLLSALCHDIRHPGLNNTYQVNAQTPLAMLYNDQAVLEHHHAATLFRILAEPQYNIFQGMTRTQYKQVRQLITAGILSTDLTCHFSMLEKFNVVLENVARAEEEAEAAATAALLSPMNASPSPTSTASHHGSSAMNESKNATPAKDLWMPGDSDRQVIFNVMLHSADISNPCKPWLTSRRWSDSLLKELFHQGDVEKAQNLPVSPNSDRDTTDQAQLTLNFIDFIVAPLFVSLRQLLPKATKCLVHLKDNRNDWAKIYAQNIEKSARSKEEKVAEKKRWIRRTESFHQILLLPADVLPNSHMTLVAGGGKRMSGTHTASMAVRRRNSILVLEKFAKANASPARPPGLTTTSSNGAIAPATPLSGTTPSPTVYSYSSSPQVTPSSIQRSASQSQLNAPPSVTGVMPPPILVNRTSSAHPSPTLGPQSSPLSTGSTSSGGSGHHVHFSPSLPPLPHTPYATPPSPFAAPLTLSAGAPSPLLDGRQLIIDQTMANNAYHTGRLPPVPDSPHEPATPPSPEPGSPLTWLRGSSSNNSIGSMSNSSSMNSLSGISHTPTPVSATHPGVASGTGTSAAVTPSTMAMTGYHRRAGSAPESTPIGPAGVGGHVGNNGQPVVMNTSITGRPPSLPEAPDSPMSPFPVRVPLKSPSGRPTNAPNGNDDWT